MVRGIAPRSLALSDLRTLKRKVAKNTKALQSKEVGRIRIVMDSTPDTTAVVQLLSAIPQGDDVDDRHGRKIHAESLMIRGSCAKNTASTVTFIRLFIFRDNLGSTTAPTLTDVHIDEAAFIQNKNRLANEQPMKRFTVLWDHLIILNESFDGQVTGAAFKKFIKLNHNILFTGTAVTDEGKNSLWLMSASDEATNVPSLTGDIIFRYTDL